MIHLNTFYLPILRIAMGLALLGGLALTSSQALAESSYLPHQGYLPASQSSAAYLPPVHQNSSLVHWQPQVLPQPLSPLQEFSLGQGLRWRSEVFQIYKMANKLPPYGRSGMTNNSITRWIQKTQRIVGSFDGSELGITLLSLVKLKVREFEFEVSRDFYKGLEINPFNIVKDFDSRELANFIYNLSVLRYNPGDAFWEAWESQALKNFTQCNDQSLAISIYAMGLLGHNPSMVFWTDWENLVSEKLKQGAVTPSSLNNIIFGVTLLEILKIETPELEISQNLIKLKKDCVEKFIAMAVTDIKQFNSDKFIRQLHLAIQYFNEQYQEYIPNCQKFLLHLKSKKSKEVRLTPNLITLNLYLKSRIHGLEDSVWNDVVASRLHFALPLKKIAIQYDDPSSFIRDENGREYLSPKIHLQNILLKRAGWKVIRIPYHYFDSKKGELINPVALDSDINKIRKEIFLATPHATCNSSKDEVKVFDAPGLEAGLRQIQEEMASSSKEDHAVLNVEDEAVFEALDARSRQMVDELLAEDDLPL